MFCTFLPIESFPLLHTYLLSSYYHTSLCSVFFTLLWPRQIHIIIHTAFFIGTTILFLSAYCKYIVFTINSTIVLALQYAPYVFFRFLCFFFTSVVRFFCAHWKIVNNFDLPAYGNVRLLYTRIAVVWARLFECIFSI